MKNEIFVETKDAILNQASRNQHGESEFALLFPSLLRNRNHMESQSAVKFFFKSEA